MSEYSQPLTIENYEAYTALFESLDRLHREAHPEYFRQTVETPRSREYFQGLIENPHVFLIGAFRESELVGLVHAVLVETPGDAIRHPMKGMHIDNLIVSPHARRQGFGRMLFYIALGWMKGHGGSEVHLKVYEFNEEARLFYASLGFSDVHRTMRLRPEFKPD